MDPGSGIVARGAGRAGRFAAEGLFFALAYLLFIGEASGAECAAAIAAGVLASAFRSFLTRRGIVFAAGLPDAARLSPRIMASLSADIVRVGAALARLLFAGRKPDAGFVEVPFRQAGPEPRVRTRRGLVVAGVSVAPNRYVADIIAGPDRLLVHQLVRAWVPEDERWPV